MRTKPEVIVASALLMALGACTGTTRTQPDPDVRSDTSARADVLVLATADGSMVVDTSSGSVLASDPGAVAAPDGSRLYTDVADAGSTTIETVDAASGLLLSATSLDGTLDVRVASLSGHAVALMDSLPPGADPWIPTPRARTSIVVADPTGAAAPRRFRLAGNFEPEAFSVDDRRLFLIQYLPAEAPTAYRVTFLDLASGDIRPVFGRFNAPPERMPGLRLRQVFDPVTSQLYTLYSTEPSRAANGYWEKDYAGASRDVTFVHVLSLRQGWAYCAGLPRDLWGQPPGAQAMVTSPDGRSLYVIDSMRGVISRMDTHTLKITDTEHVPLGPVAGTRTSASISADGAMLYVGSAGDGAVYSLDTATLQVTARWPMSGAVTDLALSVDGARLYAALRDRVAVVDAGSGAELGTLPLQGVDAIVNVESPSP